MKMRLLKLIIKTKKDEIEFPFSKSLTYIYGKMGAGKTTVTRLISYCFGEELINTPALQQEFVGASLNLFIGNNFVILSRDIYEKGKILVEWKAIEDKSNTRYVQVPIDGTKDESVLPDEHIENISDMLFYLMGVTSPKVRRNKTSENSTLIRLSFKNIMWFWYLDQDSIDSSFFHLEEKKGFYKNSSRDVMRMILGFYYERIASLENELSVLHAQRLGLEESILLLTMFLNENGIESLETIEATIIDLQIGKQDATSERDKAIQNIWYSKTHIVDKLRIELRKYLANIKEMENASEDVTKQIEIKRQLKEEYFFASIKSKNLNVARDILKDVEFKACPQCGIEIKATDSKDNCFLCHRTINKDTAKYTQIESDLIDRRRELEDSLSRMLEQQTILLKQLDLQRSKKQELDIVLTKEEKEYDSLYLANIKQFDKQLDIKDSEIKYWEKIKELPRKIDLLKTKLHKIQSDELSKKEELIEAKEESDKQENRLEELKKIFIKTLNRVKFPGIQPSDSVYLTTKDFYPKILTKDNDIYEIDFIRLSSGGKKTIFKACFAFAIQQLLINKENSEDIPFPNILIIDTPMKNISERENQDIFQSFYEFVYDVMQGELKDLQLIIVDKEFYQPDETFELPYISKHMTPDDPNNPGLIPYYRGH